MIYCIGNTVISEVVLFEAFTGTWALFYVGNMGGRIFQTTVFLEATTEEEALEETYVFLLAEDDDEKRHQILAITTIMTDDEVTR